MSVQKHLGKRCGPGSRPARLGEAEEGREGRKLPPAEEASSEARHAFPEQGACRPLRAPGGRLWGRVPAPKPAELSKLASALQPMQKMVSRDGGWGVLGGSGACSH